MALSPCSFLTVACSGHFKNYSDIKYWNPLVSIVTFEVTSP